MQVTTTVNFKTQGSKQVARYKRILLAVDLASRSEHIIGKAMEVVSDNGAELLLVHVNEPVATAYQASGLAGWSTQIASLDEQVRKIAEQRMDELATRLGVPGDNCFLPFGRAATEIRRVSEEQDVDLIVMGTHGRHGLELVLGSTASGVLHGVNCDVLAIRANERDE